MTGMVSGTTPSQVPPPQRPHNFGSSPYHPSWSLGFPPGSRARLSSHGLVPCRWRGLGGRRGGSLRLRPRRRLVTRALAPVLLTSLGSQVSFYLLLSVVALDATSVGVGESSAGLLTGTLMLSTVAAELVTAALAALAGAALFGAGFGIAQNASLTLMFQRAPSTAYGTVSAVWNLAYDTGLGLGAAGLGALPPAPGSPRRSPSPPTSWSPRPPRPPASRRPAVTCA
jgi:hypothetical protein